VGQETVKDTLTSLPAASRAALPNAAIAEVFKFVALAPW
jgi:hypothetical protein